MNILFINEYDWFKGVVFDIHVFAEGLSLLGHRVYAIDSEWGGRIRLKTHEVKNVARVYPGAAVQLSRPGFINLPGLGLLTTSIAHYREIQNIIRAKNIDAIVLYSVLTNGLSAVRLARKFNIPLIFRNIDMLHNLMPTSTVRALMKYLERRVYPQADVLLALTPKYAEYLVKLGADKSRIKLLVYPVDTSQFHPGVDYAGVRQKWGFKESDKVIVFMGTLFQFGGVGDFLRQFPEVVRQVPGAKLLILGDGPLRPKLEKMIIELGLPDHVIITGFQPFSTMPQYINLADVCINAFPISEATKDIFSAKIVQYLACGKATVSTPLPGITTLIPGESQGVIYADSAVAMAKEGVLLLKSPERRQQLGQAGLDYVRREHNREELTRQLETCLEEAIGVKRTTVESKVVRKVRGT